MPCFDANWGKTDSFTCFSRLCLKIISTSHGLFGGWQILLSLTSNSSPSTSIFHFPAPPLSHLKVISWLLCLLPFLQKLILWVTPLSTFLALALFTFPYLESPLTGISSLRLILEYHMAHKLHHLCSAPSMTFHSSQTLITFEHHGGHAHCLVLSPRLTATFSCLWGRLTPYTLRME